MLLLQISKNTFHLNLYVVPIFTQLINHIPCPELSGDEGAESDPAHLAAGLAVADGVGGEAVAVLEVGEGLDGAPGLQVARHADRRPHLHPVVHAVLHHVAVVQRLVLGLHAHTHT